MNTLTVKEILKGTGGELICGSLQDLVKGVSIDTRTLNPGEIFFALRGENGDGHTFLSDAIKKGACGVVVEKNIEKTHFPLIIRVKNTLTALGDLSKYYRKKFSIPIISITGSNGKTTTREIIRYLLSQRYRVIANEHNYNNLIGVPLTLFKINFDTQLGIVELGSNHPGEIERLAEIVSPTIGVITNIGPAHLEYFGSLEGVLKEKVSMLKFFDKDGVLIFNNDDQLLSNYLKDIKINKISFGIKSKCDLRATNIEIFDSGLKFKVNYNNENASFFLNTIGIYNIYNFLAGVCCAILFKFSLADVSLMIKDFSFPSSRLETIKKNKSIIIDDSYNANPASFQVAIESIQLKYPLYQKILVVGEMLELGKHSLSAHYQLGKLIGKIGVDFLFIKGRYWEAVKKGAIEEGLAEEKIKHFTQNTEIIPELKKLIKNPCVVLIKGSHKNNLVEIANILK